jgi:hypothetical protein
MVGGGLRDRLVHWWSRSLVLLPCWSQLSEVVMYLVEVVGCLSLTDSSHVYECMLAVYRSVSCLRLKSTPAGICDDGKTTGRAKNEMMTWKWKNNAFPPPPPHSLFGAAPP